MIFQAYTIHTYSAANAAPNSLTLASHEELKCDDIVAREVGSKDMVSSYGEFRPCLSDDPQTETMTAV